MHDIATSKRFTWDFDIIPIIGEAIKLGSIRAFVKDIITPDFLVVECLCTAAELNKELVLQTYLTQKTPTVEEFISQSKKLLYKE